VSICGVAIVGQNGKKGRECSIKEDGYWKGRAVPATDWGGGERGGWACGGMKDQQNNGSALVVCPPHALTKRGTSERPKID